MIANVTAVLHAAESAMCAAGAGSAPAAGVSHTRTSIASQSFDSAAAMNALELMDAKLDPGAAPPPVPVRTRLVDGSLPLVSMTLDGAREAADILLQQELSWIGGNSFAQTLHGCAYTHPEALQAMRGLCALTPHMSLRSETVTSGGNASAPQIVPTAVQQHALPADSPHELACGSDARAAVLTTLALATATLKSCDLNHRAVLRGDLWDEDDYYCLLAGVDVASAIPLADVFALLDSAESELAHAELLIGRASLRADVIGTDAFAEPENALDNAFPPLPSRASFAPAVHLGGENTFVCGGLSPAAQALRARICYRRAYLYAQTCLSEGAAAPGVPPLPSWARRYRLCGARAGLAAALAALSAVEAMVSPAASAPSTTTSSDAAASAPAAATGAGVAAGAGYFPEYRRLLMHSSMPRYLPPAADPLQAITVARAHLHALQIAVQLPALASHNPVASAPGASRVVIGGPPALATMLEPPPSQGVVPAFALCPRNASAHNATLPRTLADIYPVAVAAVAARSPASASDGDSVGAKADEAFNAQLAAISDAASLLAWPTTAKERADDVPANPQPIIPASGLLDSPAWVGPGMPSDSDAAAAQAPRQHVSLDALLVFLEEYSHLSADVVARSILAAVMLQCPPSGFTTAEAAAAAATAAAVAATEDSLPDAKAKKSSPASFSEWSLAPKLCATVLGTHTLVEILQRSLLDAGVSLEELVSEDARRLVFMLTNPVQTLLRAWCATRLRLRRRMPTLLRDWDVVLAEAECVDLLHGSALDEALLEAENAHVHAATAASGSLHVPPPLSLDEHARLYELRVAAPHMGVSPWALGVILQLLRTHFEVGFECDLFHVDELAAVYWYYDHVLVQSQRVHRQVAAARFISDLVPELTGLSLRTAQRMAGLLPQSAALNAHVPPAAEAPKACGVAESEADGSAAAIKSSGRARKRCEKSAAVAAATALQDDGDFDDEALEHAQATALQAASRESMMAAVRARGSRTIIALELLRLNLQAPMPAAHSIASDTLAAHITLCRAHVRVLATLQMTGRVSALFCESPPSPTASVVSSYAAGIDSPPPAHFRDATLAFAARFGDFASLHLPKQLTHEDLCAAFALKRYDGACARALLCDALVNYDAAIETLKRARASAASATTAAGVSALLAAGEATRTSELLLAVLLDQTQDLERKASQLQRPATAASRGSRKAPLAVQLLATVAAQPQAPSTPAFGVAYSDLGPALRVELAVMLDLLRRAARPAGLNGDTAPPPARQQRPAPLTSAAVIYSGRAARNAERLLRVAVTSRLFVRELLASLGPLAAALDLPRPLYGPAAARAVAAAAAAALDDEAYASLAMPIAGRAKGKAAGKGKKAAGKAAAVSSASAAASSVASGAVATATLPSGTPGMVSAAATAGVAAPLLGYEVPLPLAPAADLLSATVAEGTSFVLFMMRMP